jgi:hypothetical protein
MVLLCTVADDFRDESGVRHVVDVAVNDLGHCGFRVKGRQVVVSDVFIVGEVGAGVSTSCSQWLSIGWVSFAKGPFQGGVFPVEDVLDIPCSDIT